MESVEYPAPPRSEASSASPSRRITPADLMLAASELLARPQPPAKSAFESVSSAPPAKAPAATPAPPASPRGLFPDDARERRAAPVARDVFSVTPVRDTSRTHLAFSNSRARATEPSHSPPLGSAFATRRPTPALVKREAPPSHEAAAAAEAFELGLERYGRHDYEGALEAWREAVALMPSHRTYQSNLRRLEQLLAGDGR